MKHLPTVTNVAKSLSLLDGAGKLVMLDSLAVLDFVTAIETETGTQIPTARIHEDAFRSLETVAELLESLDARA